MTGLCVADSLSSSSPPVSDEELNLQPLSLKYVHRVYEAITPECFYIDCVISPPLINICLNRGNEAMVADARFLLHHLSTESRRIKAIEELIRVVRKCGLAFITVWAVDQEDRTLLTKWTPLSEKYSSERVGPGSPRVRGSPSPFALGRIPKTDENGGNRIKRDSEEKKEHEDEAIDEEGSSLTSGNENDIDSQQEYFVPWHLPYHRAEISGASVGALASGLAKRDDKKGTVVYSRYYHVFKEGELERLTCGIKNAVIRDRFYDKFN
ncbi:hypothetical protein MKW92_009481 [Papaver armeniacum]|nr:hypothetical protein MKW92_009481 [Papaver armeniacum]